MERFVIIGNGAAGNCAAEELRARDKEVRITVISAEPTQYLHRHRLAPWLVSDRDLDDLAIHAPEWYQERRIRLRLAQPVVHINTTEKTLLLAHRERIAYDRLLICSGARHRIPEYLSHFEGLLTKFSNSLDAILLKKRMAAIKHVTLLGGDFVGLQLMSALQRAGKKVTLVLDEYRFWPLEYDGEVKKRLADSVSNKGVEVLRDEYVTSIARHGKCLSIETRGGKKIETDEALVCSGMTPNLDFLADSRLDVQVGVLVNERLEATANEVWAAGECAEIYYPQFKDYRTSTGHQNACIQGRTAAANMLDARQTAPLADPGEVHINGDVFKTYGWKGFSLDEEN